MFMILNFIQIEEPHHILSASIPSSVIQKQVMNPNFYSLKGVDLRGGDIKHIKTKNPKEGEKECQQACSKTKKCEAYTFAISTHTNVKKQGSCWLKGSKFTYFRNKQYHSGIKSSQ